MSYIALLLLIATCSNTLYADTEDTDTEEDETQKVIIREAIFKNKPKTTWMSCNYNVENQTCAWTLGPLGKTLTVPDPPNSPTRHKLEISNTSNYCGLRIHNINFGDEGIYECILDNDPPKYRWHLIILGNPGPPVISYANGTAVWDDMIAIDETPATISLRCVSTGARPEHKRLFWLINGKVITNIQAKVSGPISELYDAVTEMSVTFTEEDENEFVVKSIACVSDHATGRVKVTKVFGIRNPNDTLHFEHYDLETSDHGRLKCDTHLFPRPSVFEILRLKDHPNEDDSVHVGQDMYVKRIGNYICRAGVETYRSSSGEARTYNWLESEVIEIEDESEEFDSSAAPTTLSDGSAWRRTLEIGVVAVNLLVLNWAKNII